MLIFLCSTTTKYRLRTFSHQQSRYSQISGDSKRGSVSDNKRQTRETFTITLPNPVPLQSARLLVPGRAQEAYCGPASGSGGAP